MSKKATIVGTTVFEYLERFPDLPSRSIARKLNEDHPLLFPDIDSARSSIRYFRGQNGQFGRKHCSIGKFYKPAGSVLDGYIPLPPPLADDKPWAVVPLQFKRALLISDIHVPYHNVNACRLAIQHGLKLGVDCVIVNGDLCDFHSVSFWERDPRRRFLVDELESARRFLEVLRDTFPKARIVLKEGNHEERLWRWVWARVPEFAGLKELSLNEILYLPDYGIELVDNKKPIRCANDLYILHGHEFRSPFQNPVNAARGLYLRANCNAICGDLHQTSQHTGTGLEKTISCWSVGCLCDLHPRYMPLNKWNLGFAFIEILKKNWRVENFKIINGMVV
jgi:predicted phosphodiesterase